MNNIWISLFDHSINKLKIFINDSLSRHTLVEPRVLIGPSIINQGLIDVTHWSIVWNSLTKYYNSISSFNLIMQTELLNLYKYMDNIEINLYLLSILISTKYASNTYCIYMNMDITPYLDEKNELDVELPNIIINIKKLNILIHNVKTFIHDTEKFMLYLKDSITLTEDIKKTYIELHTNYISHLAKIIEISKNKIFDVPSTNENYRHDHNPAKYIYMDNPVIHVLQNEVSEQLYMDEKHEYSKIQ